MDDGERAQLKVLDEYIRQVTNGNFAGSVDTQAFDDVHRKLFESIQNMVAAQQDKNFQIQASTSEIRSVSAELSVTLEENQTFVNDLYASAKELSKLNDLNYSTTARAIDRIREIVELLAGMRDSSAKADETSRLTARAIDDGLARVLKIIELSGHMEESTKKTVEFVGNFSELTESILKILKSVDSIAKETEILSFNATIEARRAGEAGKGFAVIASAIRDLADGSKKEVSEIGDVIDEIKKGFKNLSDQVGCDYDVVRQCVEHTRAVESGLQNIQHSYSLVGRAIVDILSLSERQNALADEVTEQISAVEQNSEAVNSGFSHVYQQLSGQRGRIAGLNRLSESLLSNSGTLSKLAGKTIVEGFDSAAIQSSAKDAIAILEREILSLEAVARLEKDACVRAINRVVGGYRVFDTVWANDKNGRFVYSNPPEPPGFTNAKDRDWFQEAAKGKEYISPVYISVTNKKPCVTVSLPIFSPASELVGVLCADIKFAG